MKRLAYLLLLTISLNVYAQSPWTQNKSGAYLQLNFTTIPSYSILLGNPEYNTERAINDNTLQFYVEYGLSDKTTLIANLPFKMLASNEVISTTISPFTTEDSQFSLGNFQLGLKHKFYHEKWLISGLLLLEANTGSYEDASGLRTGYDAWTLTPMIIIGRGFDDWYLQGFTGVDIRTNGYSNGYKLGGEIGYKALDWLWIAGFLDGVAAFQDGSFITPRNNRLTGLYVNNQSYAAFGFKIIGEFYKNIGVNFGLGGAFNGRNVAKSPAISVGFYYKI